MDTTTTISKALMVMYAVIKIASPTSHRQEPNGMKRGETGEEDVNTITQSIYSAVCTRGRHDMRLGFLPPLHLQLQKVSS